MSKKAIINIIALVIVVLGVGYFINFNKATDTTMVKIGYRDIAGHFTTFVAKNQNLFEKEGLNVEFVPFTSGSESYNALVRGDIQYDPYATIIPLLLNDEKEPGVVKIAKVSSLTLEEKFDQLVVKNESSITKIGDLAGKKVGVNPGTTATTFLKVALRKNNIDPESVTYVQLPAQNQLLALEAGSIDVLMAYEPTIAIALDTGKYRTIHNSLFAEAFPGSPMVGSTVNGKFAADHPGLVKKLDQVYKEAQDYASAHPVETKNLIAAELKISTSTAEKINLSYLGDIQTEVLQNFINTLFDLGELKSKPVITNIIYR